MLGAFRASPTPRLAVRSRHGCSGVLPSASRRGARRAANVSVSGRWRTRGAARRYAFHSLFSLVPFSSSTQSAPALARPMRNELYPIPWPKTSPILQIAEGLQLMATLTRTIRKKPRSFRHKSSDVREKPPNSRARGVYPFQARGYTPFVQKGYTLFGRRGLPLGHKGDYPPSGERVYPFAAKGYTPWGRQRAGFGKSPTGFPVNAMDL